MSNSEQWKSGGDCSICRRKGYCKKACSAHEKSFQRSVLRGLANTPIGMTMLAVRAALSEGGEQE